MSSTFGDYLRVTTFGESHGIGVGAVIDGFPANIPLTESDIQAQLDRRRPGQSSITTPRCEADTLRILSGVENGKTLGTPIALVVENKDQRPNDYSTSAIPRPSHADYTYMMKYGIAASSGGGRASARETVGRVAAGAAAEIFLRERFGVEIVAFVSSVGGIAAPVKYDINTSADSTLDKNFVNQIGVNAAGKDNTDSTLDKNFVNPIDVNAAGKDNTDSTLDKNFVNPININTINRGGVDKNPVRCPDPQSAKLMEELIKSVKDGGDSIGGIVTCVCRNVPAGWGEPVFQKLEAQLAQAMMSIPASRGFEIGAGFASAAMRGSEHNDLFVKKQNGLGTLTNRSGGVQGGISNGEPIYFRVAFKPTATIGREQTTADYQGGEATLKPSGRHDPCVLPRAVPVVESMAALVLADMALAQAARRR